MSTLTGYVLGRVSAQSEQSLSRAAQGFSDILAGSSGNTLLDELNRLRAENARLREVAATNRATAEANHASALSWLQHAAELEEQLEAAQQALRQR